MRKVSQLLAFLMTILCHAQEDGGRDRTPKYSNEFLQIGVGARAFGLSLGMVSHVSDVTAGYWNPAGLMRLEKNEGALMHASYFGGLSNYDYAAYSTRYDDQSRVALSVIRFSTDDIPDTRFLFDANGAINYDNIQFFAAADYAFIGSYARKVNWLGGLDAGGNVKIIHRTVGDFSKAWGFGMDFGVQKQIGDWQLGLVGRDMLGTFNAWSHNVEELEEAYALTGNALPESSVEITVPRLILGASRTFTLSDNFKLLSTVDLDFTFDGQRNTLVSSAFTSMDPHGGVEIGFKNQVFLRLGIGQFQRVEDFDGATSWSSQSTAGLGVDLGQVTVDYALTDTFGSAEGLYSHVFSIKIQFDEKE